MIFKLAESVLETIPKGFWSHFAIRRHSKRRGKPPGLIRLVIQSLFIKKLGNKRREGDQNSSIALLEALGLPLTKERILRVYVHTKNNYVVTVNSEVRLPGNCDLFTDLLEQLFE